LDFLRQIRFVDLRTPDAHTTRSHTDSVRALTLRFLDMKVKWPCQCSFRADLI
jgi:hypothetical protein